MTKATKIPGTDEAWETGLLGESAEHAKPAPAELEARIDEMLDLQMISIRLPKAMIEDYRYIAARAGLKYQSLMKQALQRFVVAEMKLIATGMEKEQHDRMVAQDQPRRRAAC